jgi:3-deoxy-D-manno-octulosonic-acid transferase
VALALWNCLITLLWPLLLLYAPFRGTLRARLGNFDLERYNPSVPGLKVLINAVSAGEVVAITSFVQELRRQRPDAQIALLTTTDSGQTMARQKLGELIDLLAYFPLIDLPFVVRRYLAKLRPDVYVTTEAEVWPNIQRGCQRRGIPVALVNARVYMHNKRGLRLWLVRKLYSLCDLIICQDGRHRENFLTLGVPAAKLTVSGNTKFDFALEDWDAARLAHWRDEHGMCGSDVVITAGSTHPGEEELVLAALAGLTLRPKLVLAPRHIERAGEVVALCTKQGLRAVALADYKPGQPWDVLVVDRYGVLVDYYRLADVVIMGGTFHPKVGGHNILEATVLGKPVVVGPYQYSITAQMELLRADSALAEVADTVAGAVESPAKGATLPVGANLQGGTNLPWVAADAVPPQSRSSLTATLARLLGDLAAAQAMGKRARELTLANRGAAARAVAAVLRVSGR